jgi:hypothetical protein
MAGYLNAVGSCGRDRLIKNAAVSVSCLQVCSLGGQLTAELSEEVEIPAMADLVSAASAVRQEFAAAAAAGALQAAATAAAAASEGAMAAEAMFGVAGDLA